MGIKQLSVFVFIIFAAEIINAQDIYISSVVRDVNTHKEISGVNIFVMNTQFGTVTNLSGKFILRLTGVMGPNKVVFQHVAYEVLTVPLDSLKSLKGIYLQPRIILLQSIEVEENIKQRYEIAKDIPQPISIMESKSFELRGFVDAGDLLRTDHSIQVEEELSGKKTVANRDGNPDETRRPGQTQLQFDRACVVRRVVVGLQSGRLVEAVRGDQLARLVHRLAALQRLNAQQEARRLVVRAAVTGSHHLDAVILVCLAAHAAGPTGRGVHLPGSQGHHRPLPIGRGLA